MNLMIIALRLSILIYYESRHDSALFLFDVISPNAPFRDARSINKRDIHHKSRFVGAEQHSCRGRTKGDRLGFGRGEAVQAGSECNR